jgi:uncharacterized glyoxalase superfamily protein PhnB
MQQQVVPMIHVADVSATIDWYRSLGFKLRDQAGEDGGEIVWAALTYGNSEVMLSAGGKANRDHRREMDLYIFVEDVDDLRRSLQGRVEFVEDLHDTFYGMREFIIRDLNRFWITFGQPVRK